jgi:hypothetical protein
MSIKKAQIHTYLRQYDNKLLTAYCHVNRRSKSEVLQNAIRQIFSNMKDFEKGQLLDIYEGMSEECRKSPKFF